MQGVISENKKLLRPYSGTPSEAKRMVESYANEQARKIAKKHRTILVNSQGIEELCQETTNAGFLANLKGFFRRNSAKY